MPRILVIDDTDADRRYMADCLQAGGYAVTLATSAADAERLIAAAPFSLAICDVCMPEVDGIAAIRLLRRHVPDLPVVVASAVFTLPAYMATPGAPAVQAVLRKPFSPADLIGTVDRLLPRIALSRLGTNGNVSTAA